MADQRTLILGGARSGKSIAAERRLSSEAEVLYVATGGDDSGDAEWAERVAKHQARRPASWGLVETIDLVPLLEADGPPLLIDCLTLWLSRTMDALDIWTDLTRADAVEQRIAELAEAWSATSRVVVAVSNDIGSGVVPADAGTRLFRDLMGRLNTTISLASDQVLWTIAGRTIPLT
jgi:adenosylcobinamide kinase/adenosylcobinamide-phosphate guanylyltransferase